MAENHNKIYVLLGMAAILWGAQPVVVKAVLRELSPVLITFYRYVGISAILLLILLLKNGRDFLPPSRHLLSLTIMGITGITLNNVLQFSGLQYSTVINCTLVSAMTPAITAVLTVIFLREPMNGVQWTGIVLSFFGVVFLVAHGSLAMILNLTFNHGDLLFFASQACWGVYTILGRKVMVEVSPMKTTAWAGLAGALATGIYALMSGDTTANVTAAGMWSMSYMILGGGVLAMMWWNHGVKAVGPSQAAVFINIMPLVGMTLAVVLLGEQLGWLEIAGGLLVLFGVYLTTQSGQLSWWPKRFYGQAECSKTN